MVGCIGTKIISETLKKNEQKLRTLDVDRLGVVCLFVFFSNWPFFGGGWFFSEAEMALDEQLHEVDSGSS